MRGADDFARARSALFSLDAACGRDDWVRDLMAFKSAGGDEDTARQWSAQADCFCEAEFAATWRSIKPNGGVGDGTLFKRAADAGWRDLRKANGHAPPPPPAARPEKRGTDGQTLWDAAAQAATHSYAARKHIPIHGLRVAHDGVLLVPFRTLDGELKTLQRIYPDGKKKNLAGASFGASLHLIGEPVADTRVYVAEGLATGYAIARADYNACVAVTAGIGRFVTVARAVLERFPQAAITFVADRGTEQQTEAAACAVGATWVAMPDSVPKGYDAWDFEHDYDTDALAGLLTKLRQPETEPPCDADVSGNGEPGGILLTCAADVTPERVEWLWPGFLPLGKLCVLAGCTGVGKTTIALHFAAIVSCAGTWPDGGACREPSNVLIWSGEDEAADTLVPRLLAAGADPTRVHFIAGTVDAGGRRQPFDPASDIPLLAQRIAVLGGARLLIIDPIVSAVSGDAHKASDVRRNLQPLVDLAASYHCAVLGISHFSKGSRGNAPVERVIGSQAFGALARIVLVAAHDDASERHVFARAKSNIAPDTGGFNYELEQVDCDAYEASRIVWGEWLDGNARDLLGDVEQDSSERTELDEATDFLADLLADGPVMAKRLKEDADGAGHNWKMMQRASHRLGVETRKTGLKGGWQWALPKKTRAEEDTKEPGLSIVSPSGANVPFGPGKGLRDAEEEGSTEGDIAGSADSSEPGV